MKPNFWASAPFYLVGMGYYFNSYLATRRLTRVGPFETQDEAAEHARKWQQQKERDYARK